MCLRGQCCVCLRPITQPCPRSLFSHSTPLSAMEQSDEELARTLQEQEYEAAAGPTTNPRSGTSTSPITLVDGDDSATDLGHGLDIDSPFKDLHSLFLAFNDQYFESKLSACEVRWSPRMTRWYGCLLQYLALPLWLDSCPIFSP